MDFNNFRRPVQQQRPHGDGCKIKIKNTASGKQIEFSGNCTKEQLEMAKLNLGDNNEQEDEE